MEEEEEVVVVVEEWKKGEGQGERTGLEVGRIHTHSGCYYARTLQYTRSRFIRFRQLVSVCLDVRTHVQCRYSFCVFVCFFQLL